MPLTAEPQMEHIGTTSGCADHDRDLLKDLGRRLDFLWHCDQFIANADGNAELQSLWRDLKKQESQNIKRMKELVAAEIEKNCF